MMVTIRSLADISKAEPEFTAQVLQPPFAATWEEKQPPEDWTERVIVQIPKKGAFTNCYHWRGVTLLLCPARSLPSSSSGGSLKQWTSGLRQEQAGFRKGRWCTDQIFTLCNIVEQCTEWQMQLNINYVHFETAFDSIHRENLCRIRKTYGIPQVWLKPPSG